jgi:hypothetical protein
MDDYGQRMRSRYAEKIRNKTRDKVKKKVAAKRGREDVPDKAKDITIEQALATFSNETFLTSAFQDNHVSRTGPSREVALKVAVRRGVPTSTTLFLEGEDYQILADDIRDFHAKMYRTGGGFTLFTTAKAYPYIDVNTAPLVAPVPSDVQYGRIRFSMVQVGSADLGHATPPVYGIHHLQEMHASGQEGDGEKGGDGGSDDEGEVSASDEDL